MTMRGHSLLFPPLRPCAQEIKQGQLQRTIRGKPDELSRVCDSFVQRDVSATAV
jgi:hypothetical protein